MLSEKKNKLYTKIILRTIFYQFLILFIGVSIGFILNAEYFGNKAPIIGRSVQNIFAPLKYSDEVELQLMKIGKYRLWVELDCPSNLTCYNSVIVSEEWFETDYSYRTNQKNIIEGHYRTRIHWKPWESYFPDVSELNKDYE